MTLQLTRSGTAKSSMWTCANLAPVCRVVYGVSIDTRPASRAWYLPGGFFFRFPGLGVPGGARPMKSGGSRRAASRWVAGPADAPCGHGPRSPRPCCGASTQAAPRDPPLHTHPHTPHTTHPQPPAEGLTAIELSVAASIFDGVSSRTLTSRLSSWLVVANNNSTSLAGKDLPPFATTKASLPWLENTDLGFRVRVQGSKLGV